MALKLDVTPVELDIIRDVLNKSLPPDCKVSVFGSRATGRAHRSSDLDLALEGADRPLSAKTLYQIREAFTDSHLPYTVDVLDLRQISDDFRLVVQRQAMPFPMENRVRHALRFKDEHGNDFPDWEEKRLGEVGSFKSGVGFSANEQGGMDGIPLYKVSDMNLAGNENIMVRANNYVTEDQVERLKYKPIFLPSLIFAKVGAAIFLERKRRASNFLLDNNMMAFTPSVSISIEFSVYLFARTRLSKFAQVGALPSYNASDVATLKVSIPHPAEQRKIAAFLSSVDRRIDVLERRLDLLNQYKRGLMQKLFTQEIRFKDEHGNDFPDWEEKRLGEGFEEIREKVSQQKIPTYSISAGKGLVSQAEKFGKDISGQQNEKYIVLCAGDFSYNKGNSKSYQYGCIYPNETGKKIAVPNVFISFSRRDSAMIVGFFAKLFESGYLDRGLRRIISSGARMDGLLNINKNYFFDLKIPFPHPAEQRKIALFLSSVDRRIEATAKQIEGWKMWKRGLMQGLFPQ